MIRHIKFGTGDKTMVIVPGLTIGYVTDTADAVETAFSAFADDYTMYLFDIREDVPEDYTIAKMGEDLVSEIKTLGLENIYLYGCSMGGMQSMYIAGTYPELVEKVAIGSSACEVTAETNDVVNNWIDMARKAECHALTDSMGQLIYSQAVFEASKPVFDAMAEALDEVALNRFANTASAIPNLDITEQAKAIKCPVLVMGAEGDKVLGAKASEQIVELTGGELYVYGAECPHAVYDEAPDFKERVKAFFDK